MIALLVAIALQSGGTWMGGTIVDIRGDIVQIRLRRQADLARVVVGKSTHVVRNEFATFSMLKPGDPIFARGEYSEGGPFHCVLMEEGSGNDGTGGLEADSYSQLFRLNGTVVSNPPLVIQDEKGKKYTVVDKNCRLTYDVPHDRSVIAIGKLAFFHGKKTADGLTDVDTAWIEGTEQNSDSYFGGKATAIASDKITIQNQFQGKPRNIAVTPDTPVYISTGISDEPIQPGARVYVQAQVIPATEKVPEAKLVSFIGIGDGPGIPISNDDPLIKTIEVRGTLESLFPCRVRTALGDVVTLVVPGQAQIAMVQKGKPTDIVVGDEVQATGTEKGGDFTAKYILVRRQPKSIRRMHS